MASEIVQGVPMNHYMGNFLFWRVFADTASNISDPAARLEFLEAVINYGLGNIDDEPDFKSDTARACFTASLPTLAADRV